MVNDGEFFTDGFHELILVDGREQRGFEWLVIQSHRCHALLMVEEILAMANSYLLALWLRTDGSQQETKTIMDKYE